jgi:predicted DNA-binding transcriptional regulator AlpA
MTLVLRKRLQKDGTLPFSTPTIRKLESEGRLPQPVCLGPRLFAYRKTELDAALARLRAE